MAVTVVEGSGGGGDCSSSLLLTLQAMWDVVSAAPCFRGNGTNGDGDGVLLSSNLSALTWQKTLGNVWQVFDSYYRHVGGHCECCGDDDGGDGVSSRPMKITCGQTVKEAIPAIQKEAMSMSMENDGNNKTTAVSTGDTSGNERILVEVCVTGSLYIVGSALEAAGWEEGESSGVLA